MSILPVTSIFVALAAVTLASLGLLVAMTRLRMKVKFGDKGDFVLIRRIRAHGNFAEYVPLALIALALIEYQGAAKWLVWALGGVLAVGRASHATAILSGILPLRTIGISLTFFMLVTSAIALLRQVL